jgi:hypothetical protein
MIALEISKEVTRESCAESNFNPTLRAEFQREIRIVFSIVCCFSISFFQWPFQFLLNKERIMFSFTRWDKLFRFHSKLKIKPWTVPGFTQH